MIELTRTNDPVLLSWLTCHLEAAEVAYVVFDIHTSILEGSIGAIPRRVMVLAEQEPEAKQVLEQAYSWHATDGLDSTEENTDTACWLPESAKT